MIKSVVQTETIFEYDMFTVYYLSGKKHEYITSKNKLPKTVKQYINTTRATLHNHNGVLISIYAK